MVSGDARFTYEQTALIGGIPFIPATIGLLCLPVMIDLLSEPGHHLDAPLDARQGQLGRAIREMFQQKLNVLRSTVIGTVIGVIPAAGGAVASLMSYSEASRAASKDQKFGQGEPAGVVASETANNATVGSGLVPTFVLGIPGTPPDAVILAAMLVHGVQIGPKLFSEHGDIVYTFVAGMLFATIMMLPVGLLLGRYIYLLVMKTPKSILAPTIALMTVIGAFAIQNSYHDVVIMLVLGIFGWAITRFGFPVAPIVLGLLLGPIAEQGFAQSMMIGQAKGDAIGYFFSNPISMILVICIVAAVTLPALFRALGRRRYQHLRNSNHVN